MQKRTSTEPLMLQYPGERVRLGASNLHICTRISTLAARRTIVEIQTATQRSGATQRTSVIRRNIAQCRHLLLVNFCISLVELATHLDQNSYS